MYVLLGVVGTFWIFILVARDNDPSNLATGPPAKLTFIWVASVGFKLTTSETCVRVVIPETWAPFVILNVAASKLVTRPS